MQGKAQFWDKIAEKYARSPVSDDAAYQKKLDVTRRYFRPDMTVLEIGCGTGTTAISHAPHVAHIHATDISENMLQIARDKAKAADVSNITFAQADIDTLDAEPESYDLVMAHSLLHLLEDPGAAIATVHRALKPGGVFVSNTVCLGESWLRIIKLIGPLGRLFGLMPFVNILKAQDIVDAKTRNGFAIDHHWQPEDKKIVLFLVALKASEDEK